MLSPVHNMIHIFTSPPASPQRWWMKGQQTQAISHGCILLMPTWATYNLIWLPSASACHVMPWVQTSYCSASAHLLCSVRCMMHSCQLKQPAWSLQEESDAAALFADPTMDEVRLQVLWEAAVKVSSVT